MMNDDGADLMENERRMANGEASEGSLRNLGRLLCGSGGVECILLDGKKVFLADSEREKKKKRIEKQRLEVGKKRR